MKRFPALLIALACLCLAPLAGPAHAANGGQMLNGRQSFVDQNGYPLIGGSVYVYSVGTTTPVTTYQDSGLTTPNTFPIVLDSKGQASIWVATGFYRQVVYDGLGNLLWDQTTSTVGALVSRSISMTGDVAWSVNFDGSTNVTAAGVLATTGVSAGTYGGSGTAAQVTVDAKGRVTAASSAALAPLWAEFRNQQTSGTANTETLTQNTWIRRTLNTTVANTIPSASLSGNQLSLPAGTYRVVVSASAESGSGGNLMTRIRNITDSTTLALGNAGSLWATVAQSGMVAEFTLSGAKTLEVQSFSSAPGTIGGYPTSSGESEIYVDIFIEKVG